MPQVLEQNTPTATTAPLIGSYAADASTDGTAPMSNPWMSAIWLDTWWEVYGAGRQVRVVAPPQGQQAWPLYHWPLYQESRRHVRHLALMGNDYCRHSLSRPGDIPALANQLAAQRNWDTLTFTSLPLAQAEQWRASLHAASIAATVCPPRQQRYVPLDRPWPEIEADIRPGLRRDLNRRRRALENLGDLQLHVHTKTDGLGRLFEACVAIEASGWKGQQGTAIASRPEAYRFYRTLAHRAAAASALHLALLYSSETLIAFSLGLVHQRVYAGVKVAYLDSWRRHGPGTVLTYRLLQRLYQEGIIELDFSGGDDRYKAEWTPHTRTLADVRAFNRTARGRLATLVSRSRAAVRGSARLRAQPA